MAEFFYLSLGIALIVFIVFFVWLAILMKRILESILNSLRSFESFIPSTFLNMEETLKSTRRAMNDFSDVVQDIKSFTSSTKEVGKLLESVFSLFVAFLSAFETIFYNVFERFLKGIEKRENKKEEKT